MIITSFNYLKDFSSKIKKLFIEGAAGTVTVRAMEYGISMFNASRILQHFNP